MPDESSLSDALVSERYLFVYGTLRCGGRNDITRLHPSPRLVGRASAPGLLYTLGPYPGMRLHGHQEDDLPVVGEVYAITPALEQQLDVIEGLVPGAPPHEDDEYAKREISVTVQGRALRCAVYEINSRFALEHARLKHGDWLLHAPAVW